MILRALRQLPVLPLSIATLFVGLAPFFPEPHLLEKLRWLAAGRLNRPLDILDLCLHLAPSLLLVLRLRLGRRSA